jgi:hypothetical protein
MVTVYEEKQKFGQWWVWSLLGGIFFIFAILLSEPNAFKLNSVNFFVFALSLVLIVLFAVLRLESKISQTEVSIKYFPLFKRVFQWDQIQSVELIEYGFVGGWGIRLTKKYGVVYNTQGSKGLFLKLKNGKKLIIGTQKEEEMKEYLMQLGKLE